MIRNNKRKGFTLVELLVVIAILAILAATAVVGYTSFIKKANQSNALSELNQIRNVVITSVIVDGEEAVAISGDESIVFEYDGETLSVTLVPKAASPELTAAKVVEAINILAEAEELSGTLSVDVAGAEIQKIRYEYAEGFVAVWDIAANTVEIE
jgi:prepilin-type N-terminal cleavage/methylation domain-containing protein